MDNKGEFRKLSTPRLLATTLSGNEEIDYELRVNSDGRLYIRMLKNSGKGGISPYFFELNSVIKDLENDAPSIVGIDDGGISGPDGNKNTKGFLHAIVNHLLPGML